MGQARLKGTFETRKQLAEQDAIEQKQIAEDAMANLEALDKIERQSFEAQQNLLARVIDTHLQQTKLTFLTRNRPASIIGDFID